MSINTCISNKWQIRIMKSIYIHTGNILFVCAISVMIQLKGRCLRFSGVWMCRVLCCGVWWLMAPRIPLSALRHLSGWVCSQRCSWAVSARLQRIRGWIFFKQSGHAYSVSVTATTKVDPWCPHLYLKLSDSVRPTQKSCVLM